MVVSDRVSPPRAVLPTQLGAPLLLAALGVALLAQGAYYPRTQLYVALLLGAALLAVPGMTCRIRHERAVVLSTGALAAWAVIDATAHHDPMRAGPYVVLLTAVVVVVVVSGALDVDARALLLAGLVALGVLVAALGWLGLVLHLPRWTWQGQGLWRASSTLTYPNATAIVLAVLALLGLAMLAGAPRAMPLALSTTVMLTGLAATLSRAGLLACAVGIVALGACVGPRLIVRAGGGPLLGAAIAATGLVPAMTSGRPHLLVAAIALTVGLGVAAVVPSIRLPRRVVSGLALLVLTAGIVAVRPAVVAISHARLTVDDPERAASFRAAFQVFARHPFTGAGPSLPTLTLVSADGVGVYRYAHDEYLQVLAELGVIGGVLLAALLVTLVRRLHQARRNDPLRYAGALAAAAALAVHAGFDFDWHIPAVPLLAAAVIGTASPPFSPVRSIPATGPTPGKAFT